MKILLLGSGGREHALAWKIAQSKHCDELYIAPGNAGTSEHGTNVDLGVGDFDGIGNFCKENGIDMLVVGPEQPMVDGVHDYFLENDDLSNIPVIGPQQQAAMLEGSKDFAKGFMQRNGIPTAKYRSFTAVSYEEGLEYIEQQEAPIVLKASGLAAGKGVLICETVEQAKAEFEQMVQGGKFGGAGDTVVIEQFLSGIEFSVFVITDGKNYKLLPVAKDYKRIGEGDTGLNTGGMGAVSPVPFVDSVLMQKVKDEIIDRTMAGLKADAIPYKGFIYFGLMNVGGNPYVIEYNTRLGDPEAEILLPLVKSDILELFQAVASNNLEDASIELDERAACTVILTAGGYPESYNKGDSITGLEQVEDSIVFHAGTTEEDGIVKTNGGRVLAITSYGADLDEALSLSKRNAELIQFEGKYYRKDIGDDVTQLA